MPKFTVPKKDSGPEVAMPEDDWHRSVRIPINEAIAKELTVGEVGTIKLVGEVRAVSTRQSARQSSAKQEGTLELIVDTVEAYGENEFTELADED